MNILSVGGYGKRSWPSSGGTPPPGPEPYRLVSQTTNIPTVIVTSAQKTGFGGLATASQTIDMNAGGIYGYAGQKLAFADMTLSNYFFGQAGNQTMTGAGNIGVGFEVLRDVTIGQFNTGMGYHSQTSLTTGSFNVSVGNLALYTNTTGSYNTAIGDGALQILVSGNQNTAIGRRSLFTASTVSFSTAVGAAALTLATGGFNTALGVNAGGKLTTGSQNTFLGVGAGNVTGQKVDAINSLAMGYNAITTADNQTVIGNTSVISIVARGDLRLEYGASLYGEISHLQSTTPAMNIHSALPINIQTLSSYINITATNSGASITLNADSEINLNTISGNIGVLAPGTGSTIIISCDSTFTLSSATADGWIYAVTALHLGGYNVDITASDLVNLTSTSGNILINTTDIGKIDLMTVTGDITLAVMGNGKNCNITTANGDFTVNAGGLGTGGITMYSHTTGMQFIGINAGITLDAQTGSIQLISSGTASTIDIDVQGHHHLSFIGISSYTDNASAYAGLGAYDRVYRNGDNLCITHI